MGSAGDIVGVAIRSPDLVGSHVGDAVGLAVRVIVDVVGVAVG